MKQGEEEDREDAHWTQVLRINMKTNKENKPPTIIWCRYLGRIIVNNYAVFIQTLQNEIQGLFKHNFFHFQGLPTKQLLNL